MLQMEPIYPSTQIRIIAERYMYMYIFYSNHSTVVYLSRKIKSNTK